MALGTPVAAAAAYSAAAGTTVTPAYPAGILATDVVLLFVGQKPSTANGGTVTTPAGWTLRDELLAAGGYGTTLGADTGNTNLRVYSWNTPVAGQTGNLTVTLGTNNVSWAFIVRIPKGAGAVSFGSADGQQSVAPNATAAIPLTNGSTSTTFSAGDIAIWAMCIPTDVTTPAQFSGHSVTSTGATFGTAVEINEPDSTTGNDIGGFSAYASVTAGSSTDEPLIVVSIGGTRTNVRGPVVMLRVREAATPPAQALTPTLYTNTQTFFAPTVTSQNTLTPALYANGQTFYSPTVAQGGATQNLTPSLYTNAQTFYGPTVTRSNTLTPGLYTNAPTFYSATVSASYALTATRVDNAQTFHGPTVTSVRTLAPALYSNNQTFYAPTLTQGGVVLQPGLYTNAQSFFAPTVAAGAVSLAPELLTNTQSFYAPTVSAAGTIVAPDLLVNAQSFYAPTVTPGPVTLAPQGYADDGYTDPGYTGPNTFSTPAFYQATVGLTIKPSLYASTAQFYAPTVSVVVLYPDPADVRAGVTYGPGGIYTGTMQATGSGVVYLRRR